MRNQLSDWRRRSITRTALAGWCQLAFAIIALMCCIVGAHGADPPTRVLTVRQIAAQAIERVGAIKSVNVEYESHWKQIHKLPGYEIDIPRRITTRFEAERRYFRSVPLDPESRQVPYLVVFDDDKTLRCDMKGTLRHGLRISAVFLSPGRRPYADQNDLFLDEVLGIPLSDQGRALWKSSWWYPYCLTREIRIPYTVRQQQERVDGAWCHVVECPGWDRIWVDPQLGCVIRQRERYFTDQDPISWRSRDTDFVEAAPKLWVPRKHVRESCAPPNFPELRNQTVVELTLELRDIQLNQTTDEDFKVALPAGILVRDIESGKYIKVPGKFEDTIQELAVTVKSAASPRQWWWWIAGVTAAIVFFAALVIWRRRQMTPG